MRRIQRQRTKGWRMPEGAVYVGRPTRWGNEFRPETLDINDKPLGLRRCLELYRIATARWLEEGPPSEVAAWLEPLRGRDLVCWCPLDQPCHADVLLELLAARSETLCRCKHEPIDHEPRRSGRGRCRSWESAFGDGPCRCSAYDSGRLPAAGERLEFGKHRQPTAAAETAVAWGSLGELRRGLDRRADRAADAAMRRRYG